MTALLWRFRVALAVLVVLLTAAVTGVRWLHARDARVAAEARRQQQLADRDTVIQQRTDTAAVRTAERRADSGSVARILIRVRHDTAWRTDTLHVAGDTTPRYAVPLATVARWDSLGAACDRLNHSCAREHVADSLVIDELRGSLALARTALPVQKPPSRWHVGVTGGYGAIWARDGTGSWRPVTGPSIVAGLSWRAF